MKKYKVLIGDDHELILSGLKDLLSKIQEVAQVDSVNNRADLMTAVAAKKYDIVFLDIHFGKHDGRDIAVELKHKFPNIVLVALTSFDDKDTIQSTANAGFNAFFLKSDGDPLNNEDYGKLYNWHAVNTGKLAPKGWHIASRAEWETLVENQGGTSVAGGNTPHFRRQLLYGVPY